jgi:hypothetical protein
MKLLKKASKLFILFITSGALASSAIAGPCKAKAEKVAKYKTPQMVSFVNTTINLLNSSESPNQRHLATLSKCQKIFTSGKKQAKGMEARNLKSCKNYMTKGLYEVQNIAIKLPSDEIKLDEQKQPKKIFQKKTISIKENTKNKTTQFVEKDNSVSNNDSDLMLF